MKIGHASINEFGKVTGGKSGDSTNKEVCIRDWYNKPWQYVIRCKDRDVANRMADFCASICNNNNVGYDQNRRNTLKQQLVKHNWNVNAIEPCDCDCSSFMVVCAESQGIKIKYNGNNAPNTSSMRKAFQNTGMFEVLSSSKYLTTDTYLLRGDILLKEGSHTVMALEDGRKTIPVRKTPEEIAIEVIKGKWGSGNDRKIRLAQAGYNYTEIQSIVNKML